MDHRELAMKMFRTSMDHVAELAYLNDLLILRGEEGALVWMYLQNTPVYAMDMAAHFGLTTGRVANILKKLEKDGTIQRQKEKEDLRKSRVLLTDQGKEKARLRLETLLDVYVRVIEHVGEDGFAHLTEYMIAAAESVKG